MRPICGLTRGNLAPDGSKVAYVMKRAGSPQSDLWRVNVDGTPAAELLAQSVMGGMWAADAKTIAYTLFRDRLRAACALHHVRDLAAIRRQVPPSDDRGFGVTGVP